MDRPRIREVETGLASVVVSAVRQARERVSCHYVFFGQGMNIALWHQFLPQHKIRQVPLPDCHSSVFENTTWTFFPQKQEKRYPSLSKNRQNGDVFVNGSLQSELTNRRLNLK